MKSELLEKFNYIEELLQGVQTVVVAAHENPDPDAVSSVLSIHNFLKKKERDN